MSLRHVVKQGECLSAIARRYGFRDYRLVYDHPDNADFKKKRPNPNLIYPGDVVTIPDKEMKSVGVQSGATHTFQVKGATKVLRLKLRVHGHEPVASAPYELSLGKIVLRGKLDGDGLLEQRIPVGAEYAELRIPGRTLRLRLGAMNPMRDTADSGVTGAQARLHNLGFDAGASDGIAGPRTRAAVALFQAEAKLPIHGKLDDATLAALEKSYGC